MLSSHPYYVIGEEQAVCNGAVYIGDNSLPTNAVDRHFEILKTTATSTVLPLDYKTSVGRVIFRTAEDGTRQGNRLWTIEVSGSQALVCTTLVVQFPQNPDFVALVPLLWLSKRLPTYKHFGDTNKKIHLTFPAVPFGFHKPGNVPLQLTPFLMPLEDLPEALTSMRQHYLDPTIPWFNPWSGHMLANHEQFLEAQSSSVLTMPTSSHMKGLSQFKHLIWSALKAHSDQFFMEFPSHLFTGNIVVQRGSGARIHVELKDGLCDTDNSAQPDHLTHARANESDRLIFVSRYKWDFLWTTVNNLRAYLFNRDEIPDQWWDNFTPLETTRTETWNASSGFFSDRMIHMDSQLTMVKDLERILLSYANANAGGFKAQRTVDERLVAALADDDDDDDDDEEDTELDPDDEVGADVSSMKKSKGDSGVVKVPPAYRHEITIYTDIMNICLER